MLKQSLRCRRRCLGCRAKPIVEHYKNDLQRPVVLARAGTQVGVNNAEILMFRYYSRTLGRLHRKLHELKAAPYSNSSLLLAIQEELIKKIKYVEARIRDAKSRPDPELASVYQHLLHALKSIGDGLAFLYIDRWDIKPLARNHRPGFISGKTGFRQEAKVLRTSIQNGPVLLADLTNCLRHGDIYAFKENGDPLICELKSSRGGGRAHRQMKRSRRVADYLNTDRAEGTILKDKLLIRRSLSIDLVERVYDANKAIALALSEGFGASSPEEGVVYLVDHGTNTELALEHISSLKNPAVWYLNALKGVATDFVPLALSITDSEGFVRFLDGSLMITVVIDTATISRSFNSKGFEVDYLDDLDWFMKIHKGEGAPLQISRNFMGRVACEFLSLNWLIEELTQRYAAVMAEAEGLGATV